MSAWTSLRVPAAYELVVGIYDLRNYTAYCERTDALRALDVMTRYCALAGKIIHDAGGLLIKPIGDAGLFVFSGDSADAAVTAAKTLQTVGDPWLAGEGYPGRVRTVMHTGPAAVGLIGGPGREQLDVIGSTVNIVGSMRTEGHLAITPALFRKLSPAARQLFKKHTPPISYIDVEAPRPRA
jgi:adenylate cyclase